MVPFIAFNCFKVKEMSQQELVKVTFPDGEIATYPKGTPVLQIIQTKKDVSSSITAVRANGNLLDLSSPILGDSKLEFISLDSEEGQDILRHSTSHVMAQAVQELYPGVKVSIGPSIENGFYYDFDY
ncbi:MAG: hypothetical protein JRF22_03615, partial [Deltaproteobacteria bacterium]|nr:hypothetical protein [Deltaproteobacteria bacterium]